MFMNAALLETAAMCLIVLSEWSQAISVLRKVFYDW